MEYQTICYVCHLTNQVYKSYKSLRKYPSLFKLLWVLVKNLIINDWFQIMDKAIKNFIIKEYYAPYIEYIALCLYPQ